MTGSLTGPDMAADVLVWSIALALSITMLAAAVWFAALAWRGARGHD